MKHSRYLFFLIIHLIIISMLGNVYAASSKKILLLPFNILSDQEFSFLKKGINNMLISRLSEEGSIEIIDSFKNKDILDHIKHSLLTKKDGLEFSKKFNADYFIIGNITIFGESVSTDCHFYEVQTNKSLITFGKSGKSKGEAISHVNLFAQKVNQDVFGHKIYDNNQKKTSEQYISSQFPGITVSKQGMLSSSAWKSHKFKLEIQAFSIGDIDGDKNNEIVFAGDNKIVIYRYLRNNFQRIIEFDSKHYNHIIGIDVGDINNNDRAEIFVTAVNDDYQLIKSFILEWNGSKFDQIDNVTPWFYRIINIPDRGKILLGQKRGIESDIFRGSVYELVWEKGAYEPAVKFDLPSWINIYGFIYGDILNNGSDMIAAIRPDGIVKVVDRNGNEEWTSDEKYGGKSVFIQYPSERDSKELDKVYLQHRIYIADLDQNKKNELIILKNRDIAGRSFDRLRMFNSGYIEGFEWKNIGMQTQWKTQKISGYISDYMIGDFNNDGQDELVCSVVSKNINILAKKKSYIVAWSTKH